MYKTIGLLIALQLITSCNVDTSVVMDQCDNGEKCVVYARFKSRAVCDLFVSYLQIQGDKGFFDELNRNGFATASKAVRMYDYRCNGN